jgi:hypothetical protein
LEFDFGIGIWNWNFEEMDIDRSKSIKFSKLLEKEQPRNINALEILIEKRKSVQTENIEEKETVENEMKAFQSLLEAGEFDIEMEIDRSKYIKFSTLLEKVQSINIKSLEMLIEISTSEQTPPRNNTEQSRNVKVMKRKQMHSTWSLQI